jgi:peptide alpha-N-acetyltransferase
LALRVLNLDLALALALALAIIHIMNQNPPVLRYVRYDSARENEYVAAMRQLISKDLSEPYSIYVYRYFLYQWGDLCFLAMDEKDEMVGVVVSKLEPHRGGALRGYIAMLAVREEFRGQGIATKLVRMAIDAMIERDADEVCIHLCPSALLWSRLVLACPG